MLVAGVDSGTQSCKVVLCQAEDGTVVAHGHAPHPEGTQADPAAWSFWRTCSGQIPRR